MSKKVEDEHIKVRGLYLRALRSYPERPLKRVYLHGYLDNANIFLPWLEESSLPSLALDLPGHAQSDFLSVDHSYYNWIHVADLLLESLKKISKDPVELVGHSLGAGLCTLIAGLDPSFVRSLILIDNLAPLTEEGGSFFDRLQTFYKDTQKDISPKFYQTKEQAIQARVKKEVSYQLAERLAQRGVSFLKKKGYVWVYDRRLRVTTPLRLTLKHVQSYLGSLNRPVCFIMSETSQSFLNHHFQLETTLQKIKKCELIVLEGGHHYSAFYQGVPVSPCL